LCGISPVGFNSLVSEHEAQEFAAINAKSTFLWVQPQVVSPDGIEDCCQI